MLHRERLDAIGSPATLCLCRGRFRGECQNAIDIRRNLEKAGYLDKVIVPEARHAPPSTLLTTAFILTLVLGREVFEELCSRKLMVMEEVSPSTPLHTVLEEQAEQLAAQEGLSKA